MSRLAYNLAASILDSNAQTLNFRAHDQIQNAITICQIISQLKQFVQPVLIVVLDGGIKSVHMDIDPRLYIQVCVCVCVYICICMCIYIYICICVCVCICICVYICIYMCVCVWAGHRIKF
jgi:hypothetical protein